MSSLAVAELRCNPFPHTLMTDAIGDDLANAALRWMETDALWTLRVASFYEQWELHIDAEKLPAPLRPLVSPATISQLAHAMLQPLAKQTLQLSEVTAHKLVPGQTIRIHNDYLEGQESHRLLIQLNRNWTDSQGGLLMLFGSARPEDVRRVVRPLHGSGFAFEISPLSFHAVSQVQGGERFTLVYSFRTKTAA
jgi:Rps23 Pro-64 3,4-dihydroxylase Tpa1-like proline 4-hydroxylase